MPYLAGALHLQNVQAEEKYLAEDGTLKLGEMGIIAYDPYSSGYYEVGNKVGDAFREGKKLDN